ncbi:Hypothetical predicted protein [Octopus vulgaris]|uniref:Uncharacterized protein n=1 Tax=Octopus vulgaris TaxID=6645 RepID=A0AA36BE82_OCTVU|nr:Hypothetical predicted protein [Octopus vulgaris]
MSLMIRCHLTGRSTESTYDWFNMCCKICSRIVSVNNCGEMVGSEENVNRGRIQQRDHVPDLIDSEAEVENNRNHGRRIDRSCVFELKKGANCCYFYVEKRNRETLEPIIRRKFGYSFSRMANLNRLHFHYSTVNHQRHYIDSNTGHQYSSN